LLGCESKRTVGTHNTETGDHPAPGVTDIPEPAASATAPATSAAPASSASAAALPVAAPAGGEHADSARVYAKSRNVWIREAPTNDIDWIGILWFGSSVAIKDPNPIVAAGCSGQWYAVEPRGYICVDGDKATLDIDDPVLRAVAPYAPNLDSPWPHPHYGESLGAPRYNQLPSPEEQQLREAKYLKKPGATTLGEPVAAPSAAIALPALPRSMQADQAWVMPRSALAWTGEAAQGGRHWALTPDLAWVPQDRLTPYPKVTFRGVQLGKEASLPLAFFRAKDRPKYAKGSAGDITATGENFPRLSWVELSGEQIIQGNAVYLQTKDAKFYVDQQDAVVPEVRKETPWGAATLQPDATGKAPPGRATWLETSIWGGWLLAYEGTKPVFATLIAPGRGGPPHPDRDPIDTASTPTGFFQISGKFATSTMGEPTELIHADVPWAQNFSGPHALHAAYWHDNWGELKSGGCINVSPIDGKWLYDFTEPTVPDGWHGVRWDPSKGPATGIIINRR
jgi:hypothetical protein